MFVSSRYEKVPELPWTGRGFDGFSVLCYQSILLVKSTGHVSVHLTWTETRKILENSVFQHWEHNLMATAASPSCRTVRDRSGSMASSQWMFSLVVTFSGIAEWFLAQHWELNQMIQDTDIVFQCIVWILVSCNPQQSWQNMQAILKARVSSNPEQSWAILSQRVLAILSNPEQSSVSVF